MNTREKLLDTTKPLIIGLSFTGWLFLFFIGLANYQGTHHIFVFFSIAYLALLTSGLIKKTTYGYTFLTIILWLGFWLKAVFHLLLDYPFVEPTGLFKGTPADWDTVLVVASIGAICIILGRLTYGLIFRAKSTIKSKNEYFPPSWYWQYRIHLWSGLVFFLMISATANIYYSFQQVGIVPKTVIWPLNTVIYWLLSTGFAMSITTLLWWELSSAKGNINTIYFVLLEAGSSSVSLLSRGLYIFHVIPLAFALFKNKQRIKAATFKWIVSLTAATILLFLLCYPTVNAVRNFYYSDVPFTKKEWLVQAESPLLNLLKFSVDRWIGLEGLMATSAQPEKNITLLMTVATETGKIGTASILQEIALSHYRFMDLKTFVFASLPGPISFLYLAGNYWIVAIGMYLLSLTVLMLEYLVNRIFKNPLLSALWGSILATSVAQMGLNVSGLIFYLFLCSIGFTVLFALEHALILKSFFLQKNNLRS